MSLKQFRLIKEPLLNAARNIIATTYGCVLSGNFLIKLNQINLLWSVHAKQLSDAGRDKKLVDDLLALENDSSSWVMVNF